MKAKLLTAAFNMAIISVFAALFPAIAAASTPHYESVVTRAYRMTFNRFPDPAGLRHNVDLAQQGRLGKGETTIYNNLVAAFRKSAEYTNYLNSHNGAAPEIVRIFRDVLNREPSGGATWTSRLRSDGYDAVRAAIAASAEARKRIEDAFSEFQTILPNEEQVAWAKDYLSIGGGSIVSLRKIIKERRSTVVHLARLDKNVVKAYLDVLDREPDWSGGIVATQQFQQGFLPVRELRERLASSNEFLTQTLNAVYQEVLGRGIDPSGLQSYKTAVRNGATLNQVRYTLRASRECTMKTSCNALTMPQNAG